MNSRIITKPDQKLRNLFPKSNSIYINNNIINGDTEIKELIEPSNTTEIEIDFWEGDNTIIIKDITTRRTPKMITGHIGHNGQPRLWTFLMEKLCDKKNEHAIRWTGEGEFVIMKPETVAKWWGQTKNNPKMNYDKLTRALRCKQSMIKKRKETLRGYRFTFKMETIMGIKNIN